jgi:hypothetical protein
MIFFTGRKLKLVIKVGTENMIIFIGTKNIIKIKK